MKILKKGLLQQLLPMRNKAAWHYYLGLYPNLYYLLWLGICIALGQAAPLLGIALLLRHALDQALPANNFSLLMLCAGLMILLSIIITGISLHLRKKTLEITKGVILKLREDLLKKCFSLSWQFYTQADEASLHSTIVHETERLDTMTNTFIAVLLPALISSIILCCFMLLVNKLLFATALLLILLFFSLNYLMRNLLKTQTQLYYQAYEYFSKGILFLLQKFWLIQTQTAERVEIRRQKNYFQQLKQASTKMAWFSAMYSAVQDNATIIFTAILLVMGGIAIMDKLITLGDLLSFYVTVTLLKNYLTVTANASLQLLNGEISLTKITQVLQLKEIAPYSGKNLIDFQGSIIFERVFFHYRDRPVLVDSNFALDQGSVTILRGENGSGKTTLINLILGFYRPQQGIIYADGNRYDCLDMVRLREKISIVMQNPMFFNGTVLENLCYGQEDTRSEEILAATQLAAAHDFIQQLPQGYETAIGENGVQLSGGQRQRLAIARALVRNPRLLLLDEPTNHLDNLAVQQLLSNLKRLKARPTIVIISHDHDLSINPDQQLMLANGKINLVESGLVT